MRKFTSVLLSLILAFYLLCPVASAINTEKDDNRFDITEIFPVPPETVYISSSGDDSAAGEEDSPMLSLSAALSTVRNGGTVIIKDTCTLSSDFTWTAHNKSVTVTGGTLDASAVSPSTVTIGSDTAQRVCSVISINDSVNFSNINITVGTAAVFANGYKLTMGENVTVTGDLSIFGGGVSGTTVASTDVTLLSGTYTYIFGGSFGGTVTGNTSINVGGTVNSGITVGDGQLNHIYGGSYGGTIGGCTNVTFGDSAKSVYVFGGSRGTSTITGGCNVKVSGGTIMNLYGGSWNAYTGNGTNTVVTGGTMEAAFGGNQAGNITGNTYLAMLGGTVTRRIYGGCYNNTSSLSFSTDYHVVGNATLVLGEALNVSYSSSDNDRSIYAHSRNDSPSSEENSILIYDGNTAYSNNSGKIKAQDFAMQIIMGSTTVADVVHKLSYTASGNILTQSCSNCGASHSAIATLNVDSSAEYVYSGEAHTPGSIVFSDGWYNNELSITYQNNIEPGTATALITRDGVSAAADFRILDVFTVTLDYGAVAAAESRQVIEGKSFSLPDTGFALDNNWYTSSDGNVNTIAESVITVTGDITLYSLGSLVGADNNAQYKYSDAFSFIKESGENVLYYDSSDSASDSYGSNYFRLCQVEDNTTYKITVTYKANAGNLGFAFMTANSENVTLNDTALHGAAESSLYSINASTDGQYKEAVMFVTTDLIGTLTETSDDDIKTVLGDYLFLSLKDYDTTGESDLYIKNIEVKALGEVLSNGGASILTDDAELAAGTQALRYYFDYITDDGANMYIDGVAYEIVERGFLYRNGSIDSYAPNGTMVEGSGGMTVGGSENTIRELKRDNFNTCWLYTDSTKKLTFSTYVKGFVSNDSRKLTVRGYVTILVDGQEMTVYAKSTNRSVSSIKFQG